MPVDAALPQAGASWSAPPWLSDEVGRPAAPAPDRTLIEARPDFLAPVSAPDPGPAAARRAAMDGTSRPDGEHGAGGAAGVAEAAPAGGTRGLSIDEVARRMERIKASAAAARGAMPRASHGQAAPDPAPATATLEGALAPPQALPVEEETHPGPTSFAAAIEPEPHRVRRNPDPTPTVRVEHRTPAALLARDGSSGPEPRVGRGHDAPRDVEPAAAGLGAAAPRLAAVPAATLPAESADAEDEDRLDDPFADEPSRPAGEADLDDLDADEDLQRAGFADEDEDDDEDDDDEFADDEAMFADMAPPPRNRAWIPVAAAGLLCLGVGSYFLAGYLQGPVTELAPVEETTPARAEPLPDPSGEVRPGSLAPVEPKPRAATSPAAAVVPTEPGLPAKPAPAATPAAPETLETIEEARGLYERGTPSRLVEARALLEQILAEQPNVPEALTLLAVVQLEQGEREASLETANRCTEIAPEQADCWLVLGALGEERFRDDERSDLERSQYRGAAMAAYERYLTLTPDGRYAHDAARAIQRIRP